MANLAQLLVISKNIVPDSDQHGRAAGGTEARIVSQHARRNWTRSYRTAILERIEKAAWKRVPIDW